MPDANTTTLEAPKPSATETPSPPSSSVGQLKTNPELNRVFGRMRAKANVEPPPPPKPTVQPEQKKEGDKKPPTPPTKAGPDAALKDAGDDVVGDSVAGKGPDEEAEESADELGSGTSDKGDLDRVPKDGDKPTPEGTEKAKTGPWKLTRQFEKRVRELERENAELRAGNGSHTQAQELQEKLKTLETQNKKYVEELRFHDYEKHDPEFQTKYDKPYKDAYHRAVAEINEIPVTTAEGETRAANANDLMKLVMLPLPEADALAQQMFGERMAMHVMRKRDAVKDVFDARQRALEEARTNLDARDKQRAQEREAQTTEVTKFISESWEKANRDAVTDERYGKYFQQRESDPDWNQRLAKGLELVDRAFNSPNPMDPTLTKEQRQEIIRRHAAVRHRAAAWGPLRHDNERKDARIAELEAELAEFKSSEPKPGASEKTPPKDGGPVDPMQRMLGTFRKAAGVQ